MRQLLYIISTIIVLFPVLIGFIIGFLWRAYMGGFVTGYHCIQNNMQADIIEEVSRRRVDREPFA